MTEAVRPPMPGVHVARSGGGVLSREGTAKRVLLQFRVIANAVKSSAPPVPSLTGVTDRKLLALRAVAEAPGLSMNALAVALEIRQPTASQVVKFLVQKQLVEVSRDSRDRRAVRIRASGLGLALLEGLPSQFDFGERLPRALAQVGPASLSSLEASLEVLLNALSLAHRSRHVASTDRFAT